MILHDTYINLTYVESNAISGLCNCCQLTYLYLLFFLEIMDQHPSCTPETSFSRTVVSFRRLSGSFELTFAGGILPDALRCSVRMNCRRNCSRHAAPYRWRPRQRPVFLCNNDRNRGDFRVRAW